MNNAYRDFIQFALDNTKTIPDSFDMIDWQDFKEFCHQHSILGVVYAGMERANRKIPQKVLFDWISYVESIKRQNQIVNNRVLSVSKLFEEKGLHSIILKGQANGLMYPRPELRSPGDIDIWVDAPKMDIIRMVLKEYPNADYSIHHIKMPVFRDVSVEVHYRPIYLTNWFKDKKFQRYVNSIEVQQFSYKEKLEGHEIGCLANEFNVIYQLLHMYAHFFSTRNNYKQFVDYYYLLKKGLSEEQKERLVALMKELKVLKYGRGMMWVMKETLGLEDKYLYAEPDAKIGKQILAESMRYGTFSRNKMKQVLQQFTGNFRLVRYFSSEVLISPLFLVWHQWWKIRTKNDIGFVSRK